MEHKEYYKEIINVLKELSNKRYEKKIEEISDLIIDNYQKGGILITCGNGGSAADAQHIVGEQMGSFLDKERKAFPAIALTTNTSNLTSIANDFDYSQVFSRQLQAFDNFEYILWGLSTSGNSENVNKAIEYAKNKGKITIGLSGKGGGDLERIVEYCITPPSNFTPIIQTAHNVIYHRICELVERGMK